MIKNIFDFIKKYQLKILYVILITLSSLVTYLILKPKPIDNVKEYKIEQTIDSLYSTIERNDKLRESNQKLILLYSDSIKQLQVLINTNDRKIYKLKKKHDEELSKINNYSNDDIHQYFQSRYGTK